MIIIEAATVSSCWASGGGNPRLLSKAEGADTEVRKAENLLGSEFVRGLARAVEVCVLLACAFLTVGALEARQHQAGTKGGLPSRKDRGELSLVAADVQLLLIAPGGKETGYDPKSKKILKEIPGSVYYQDALLAYDSGRVDPNTTQTLNVQQPVAGKYRLIVSRGSAADGEEYEIRVHLYGADGGDARDVRIAGTSKRGDTATYELLLRLGPAKAIVVQDSARR